MIGLILAAGAGRRLRPHTETLPKALLPVHGSTTILDVALGNLAHAGLENVVIVVGYASEAIEQCRMDLEDRHGVTIELVFNDHAEDWNNAYSLWLAREYFKEGALLINGDTLHPVSVEKTLLASRTSGLLLAIDDQKLLAEEEMKVVLDGAGQLVRINKSLDPTTADGEYIGAAIIEPGVAAGLTDALASIWQSQPHLYYEDAIQEYADRGGIVRAARIGEVDWVEVDNLADLTRAREIACRY